MARRPTAPSSCCRFTQSAIRELRSSRRPDSGPAEAYWKVLQRCTGRLYRHVPVRRGVGARRTRKGGRLVRLLAADRRLHLRRLHDRRRRSDHRQLQGRRIRLRVLSVRPLLPLLARQLLSSPGTSRHRSWPSTEGWNIPVVSRVRNLGAGWPAKHKVRYVLDPGSRNTPSTPGN